MYPFLKDKVGESVRVILGLEDGAEGPWYRPDW